MTVGGNSDGWQPFSVKTNGNRGRKKEEGYLRVPSFSSPLFRKRRKFVERTSGEVVFRAASSWIAGTPQFLVTGSWLAGTP